MNKLKITIKKLTIDDYYTTKNYYSKIGYYMCPACGSDDHLYKYHIRNQGLFDNEESFIVKEEIKNEDICCEITYYIKDDYEYRN